MKNLYVIILMLFSFTMSAQQAYNFEHHKIEYLFFDSEEAEDLKETDKATFIDLTAKIIAKDTSLKDFALKLVTEDLKTTKRTDDYYELKINGRTSVTTTKRFVAKCENNVYRVLVIVTRYFTYLDNN